MKREEPAMMPAMNMPAMPMSQSTMMPGMMPGMMPTMMPGMMPGMMPNMMGMMGMMPMMMPNGMMMMPNGMMMMPMMGMAPMMGAPLLCKMTMEMGKDGVTCKMTPLEGAGMDAMRERCESMMKMMAMGMPVMMSCGGATVMAMPAAK